MSAQPVSIQSAIDRGLRAAEAIEPEAARLRENFEAIFRLVGMKGLDILVTAERRRLSKRYPAQTRAEGYIS
jgi:hypothetical protein